jgi:hypothetical protein
LEAASFQIVVICGAQVRYKFPRNLAPDFLQYTGERPEMSPNSFGANEGQNKKRKLRL